MDNTHHHNHSQDHGHSHGHHHQVPVNFNKAFAIGITLNLIFVLIEGSFGFFSNSLALLADAGHNLSDVLGLVIAWIASVLVRKKPTDTFTFGLRSSSIFAALGNAVFLMAAVGAVLWEALHRFQNPPAVSTNIMITVAAIGILINGITAYLFSAGHKNDLNIKSAYLHMMADALVSLGVVAAGFLMMWTGYNWIDPLVSVVVSLVILRGTWSLLRESMRLAMQAVPEGIKRSEVLNFLKNKKGVAKVHDLHIWGVSTTENALTAHLVMPLGHPGDSFLHHVSVELTQKFEIHHATLQIEIGDDPKHPCALESDEVL